MRMPARMRKTKGIGVDGEVQDEKQANEQNIGREGNNMDIEVREGDDQRSSGGVVEGGSQGQDKE
jgi:hypothetical protein